MNLINTPWSCQRCGVAFVSSPPEHGLCDQCAADLEALARASQPDAPTCMECGGPVCPTCGERMTLLVLVPAPAALFFSSLSHAGEVNGDGG